MVLFWLTSAATFLVATALGTGCKLVDTKFEALSAVVEPDTINKVFDSIEICTNNGTVFDVTSSLGLFSLPENITATIDAAIEGFNITSTVNSINLSGSISFTADIASFNAALSGFNLDSIDFSALTSTTFLDDVETDINAFRSNLVSLRDSVNDGFFSYDPSSPPSSTTDAIVLEFKANVNSIISGIDSALSDLSGIRTTITDAVPVTTQFSNAVTSALTFAGQVIAAATQIATNIVDFTNDSKSRLLTTIIPTIISNVHAFAVSSLNTVLVIGNCQALAQDYHAVKNSACTSFLGGIDAIWWSFAFTSLFMMLMVVALTNSSALFKNPKPSKKMEQTGFRLPKIRSTAELA